jgi:hypothetical protein
MEDRATWTALRRNRLNCTQQPGGLSGTLLVGDNHITPCVCVCVFVCLCVYAGCMAQTLEYTQFVTRLIAK